MSVMSLRSGFLNPDSPITMSTLLGFLKLATLSAAVLFIGLGSRLRVPVL